MKFKLLLVLFYSCSVVAQTTKVSGEVEGLSTDGNPFLYVFKHQPLNETVLVDSVKISKNGKFKFELRSTGLFAIRVPGGSENQFYIEQERMLHSVTSENQLFYGNMEFMESQENRCFKKLESLWEQKMQLQNELGSKYDSLDYFDPKYNTLSSEIRTTFDSKIRTLDQIIDSIANVRSNTFLGENLAKWYRNYFKEDRPDLDTVFDNNLAFQHQHFFDALPLEDVRISNFRIFYDRIDEYMTNYVRTDSRESLENAVRMVMKNVDNTDIRSTIALYLSEKFKEMLNPDMSEYVLEMYYSESCDLAIYNNWDEKVSDLKAASVGSLAPEITLPDKLGNPVRLSSLKGTGPTLIYFWSSRCQYCTEAMPNLADFYRQFANNGFEVYAVSLDDNRQLWLQFINTIGVEWVNVFQGQEQDDEILKTYSVRGTPTYIVLDSELKIVLRSHNLTEALNEVYDELFEIDR